MAQLREERKAREAAEATASTASTEIERLHASLEATLAEKQHLEAELLEAAYDLLQKQKLETALQVRLEPKNCRFACEIFFHELFNGMALCGIIQLEPLSNSSVHYSESLVQRHQSFAVGLAGFTSDVSFTGKPECRRPHS